MKTQPPSRRNLQPRPQAPVVPIIVSAKTVAGWCHVHEERIRKALAAHPEIPRSRLGREILLSSDAVLQLLDALRVEPDHDAESKPSDDDDQPASADAVLAALGLRRTAP